MNRLFWSPSSQWGNLGAVPGYIEADFCNKLVTIAMREVARYNIPQDRNNPHETYVQHAKRAQAFGATKVICVHTNANNRTARGMNIGCYDSSDASKASTIFARTMLEILKPLSSSGIARLVTYSFHEITVAGSPPVAYCELFFHDNFADCSWGVAHMEELGIGLARGYLKSIGIEYAPAVVAPLISYQAHVQNVGWQEPVADGAIAGTEGKAQRLEALKVMNENVKYRAHVQDYGWQMWHLGGEVAGTVGQSKRLEAIEIVLEGALAETHDVLYQAHVQDIGWQGWCKNGETAGTVGRSLRVEAIRIKLVHK